MTTKEEIEREMALLDERKDELSDGEYLRLSNELLKKYREIERKEKSPMIITAQRARRVESFLSATRQWSVYELIDDRYVLVANWIQPSRA